MVEQQAQFKGFAKVEVMGHQSHVGYVTTEVYGQAVLFRIDQPAIEAEEVTLERAEWIGDQMCPVGSVVRRAAVDGVSVLVGSGSIYRIIPCDEATMRLAIREGARRPLSVVRLNGAAGQIVAPESEDDDNPEDEEFS